MSSTKQQLERTRMRDLSARLREATCAAIETRSTLATALDESRSELERLLMLERFEEHEALRALGRAQLMLDAWRSMVSEPAVARYTIK